MLPPHGKVWPSRGTHNCGVAYTYSIMTRLIVELHRISPISFLFFFSLCMCMCESLCVYVCVMFFFSSEIYFAITSSHFLRLVFHLLIEDKQHCTASLDPRRYLKIVSFMTIVCILIYCLTSLFLNCFFISSQYRDLSFLSMI